MDQPKDDMTRPDGRQEMKRKNKTRKEQSSDTELGTQNQRFYVQLWVKDDARDSRESRNGGA